MNRDEDYTRFIQALADAGITGDVEELYRGWCFRKSVERMEAEGRAEHDAKDDAQQP